MALLVRQDNKKTRVKRGFSVTPRGFEPLLKKAFFSTKTSFSPKFSPKFFPSKGRASYTSRHANFHQFSIEGKARP